MTNGSNRVDARPALQWYPSDWIRDTRLLSLEARGLWMDMLMWMFFSPKRGMLLDAKGMRIDAETLCRMAATDMPTLMRSLCELESRGILSKEDDGTIYNRRMVREECGRDARSDAGRHAAKVRWSNAKNASSSSSSSSSSPSTVQQPSSKPSVLDRVKGAVKRTQTHPCPYQKFVEVWNDFANRHGLATVRKLTEARKRKLKSRFADWRGEKGGALLHFQKILDAATSRPFMMGENDSGWRMGIDWVVNNEDNGLKLLEGKTVSGKGGNEWS